MAEFGLLELFCKKCLVHDHFFSGGGSWAVDTCPVCGGYETITFAELCVSDQSKAHEKFIEMKNDEINR